MPIAVLVREDVILASKAGDSTTLTRGAWDGRTLLRGSIELSRRTPKCVVAWPDGVVNRGWPEARVHWN